MYIGPWQDYNLARMQEYMQRKIAGGAHVDVERVNSNFKNNLEQTIINSLDPFSARKVLASLQPLLAEANKDKNDGRMHGNKLVPQLQIGQNTFIEKVKIKKSIRRNENKGYVAAPPPSENRSKKTNRRPILLIKEGVSQHPQIYKTEDDENIYLDRYSSTPPLSIRSTLSEPIDPPSKASSINTKKEKKKVYLNHRENENGSENNVVLLPPLQQQQHFPNKQPPYNTSNVISLLKLERSMRQQKQVDLSTFWDWKGKKKQELVVESDDGTDAKLNKVNKMKELYLNKGPQPLLSPLRLTQNKSTSSSKEPQRLPSPDVKDMDITDNELLLISKYFKDNEGIPPTDTKIVSRLSFMNDSPPDTPSDTYPNVTNPLGKSPNTAAFDELYVGGIDGLLNWSNNLDLDNL